MPLMRARSAQNDNILQSNYYSRHQASSSGDSLYKNHQHVEECEAESIVPRFLCIQSF
jgi:hypothetical protein